MKKNIHTLIEQKIDNKVEQAIRQLPKYSVPQKIRNQLNILMERPSIKIWHFIIAHSLLLASPCIIIHFTKQFNNTVFNLDMQALLFTFIGMLTVLLLTPITIVFLHNHTREIKEWEKLFNEYFRNILK